MHHFRIEAKLQADTEKRMEQMQQNTSLSWIEVQFLREAAETLVACRRVLQYTYAFAFYLDQSSNSTALFEDNQRDLEMAVESLAEWMQRPIPHLASQTDAPSTAPPSVNSSCTNQMELHRALQHMKQQIIDRTVYVRSRREVLLKDVAAGLQSERWVYRANVWKEAT